MDKSTGIKEMSQLLLLYNRAIELGIDLNISDIEAEYVIQDDSDVRALQNFKVLQEFLKLSKIAQEFDTLFGTH